ncbi:hypothetical protein D2V08_15710 [Flagellimonas lutimaris]|uniref:Right-handed parallel beta-helix repeat-containing protein n=2 Tax=Flagellimonas lutimaris TaxID=475082 RepID=A0A3A1N311_9FLAO|nr:hypothetical protein D2V08_15710 [Allomuricauda lutimaris]
MINPINNRMISTIISCIFIFFLSCSKDSDLFDEYVIEEDEPAVEQPQDDINSDNDSSSNDNSQSSNNQSSTVPDPFVSKPNEIIGTFYPKSSAEISDPAYANHKAVIETSFDCSNCTFASNLTIESAGGVINGSNVNLNGAFIVNTFKQLFTSSTTFNGVYNKSRLSPEIFGADGSDSIADDNALVTLMMQVEYAIGQTGSVYIKNEESTIHMRNGTFDWDMNNSTVRTTSESNLCHSNDGICAKQYLFQIRDIDLKITNGEFDGQDIASRCFYLRGVASYDFQNVNIHNYFAPPGARARGMAFLIEVENNFKGGQILNSTIANIGAASDGKIANVPYGFAKGIYCTVATANTGQHVYRGNTFSNIYGDDAEAFSNTHTYGYAGTYQHASNGQSWVIDNNNFIGSERRALKVNLSNVDITNNYFESKSTAPMFRNAQAAQIQVFTLHQGQNIQNVNVTGNTVKIVGEAENAAFGIHDATNCLIENNIFEADHISLYRMVTFGSTDVQDGLYEGDLSNTVIFRNNALKNLIVRLPTVYAPVNGGFIFENVAIDFDVDRYLNGHYGVFRMLGFTGNSESYSFKDVSININQTYDAGSLFGGAFRSLGVNMKNLSFENVNVNYTGDYTSNFIQTGQPGYNGDFDSTNTVIDCNLTGRVGTGAISVTGNSGVLIQNSMGDESTPITVN